MGNPKKKKDNVPSKKLLTSTQSFCPIQDVVNGILITKDGRFIKIIEVSPLNFLLHSAKERDTIITYFASLLKILPTNVQMKVVAKKAEVEKLIDKIKRDSEKEQNQNLRRLMREQIGMISQIGSEFGVSRRFFIIYEYEEQANFSGKKTQFSEIVSYMRMMQSRITKCLRSCGNNIVDDGEDEDLTQLAYFYLVFARSQHEQMTLRSKMYSALEDFIASSSGDDDNIAYMPISNVVSPNLISTRISSKMIVVDQTYYTFLYIPGGEYPTQTFGGWMAMLINLGEGIDVDLFIQKQPVATMQRKLQYTIRYQKLKLRDMDSSSTGYDELREAVESGYALKSGLSAGDDICLFGILITVSAASKEELKWKVEELKSYVLSQDLRLRPCTFRQEEAFISSLPLCKCSPDLFKLMRRNINTSSLGAMYPFVSSELNSGNGVMFGINSTNNSVISLDLFDRRSTENANMAILGTSGAGKTYAMQCIAMRMRESGVQVFIIAPDKGHEFKRACAYLGGQYIKIAPGSAQAINILEIRQKDTSTTELLDGRSNLNDSILDKKIQSILPFFSLLFRAMTPEEVQFLDECLRNTYAKLGITSNNRSLTDRNDPTKYRKMPILKDLNEELKKRPEGRRMYNILKLYVEGSAKTFNQQTNVDLNNKYIVLDISELTKEQRPIGMFIAIDFVWDKAKEDRTKKKAIFMDEIWTLIGAKGTRDVAEHVMEIFKVIRGYGGSAVAATQDIGDFFSLDGGTYGKAIVANSATQMYLKLKSQEAQSVADMMHLTDSERQQIEKFSPGECLLVSGSNHVLAQVTATPTEDMLVTTDTAQLAAYKKTQQDLIQQAQSAQ